MTRGDLKKALGERRAQLIAELWPQMHCTYFELATWAQEYVDSVIAEETNA